MLRHHVRLLLLLPAAFAFACLSSCGAGGVTEPPHSDARVAGNWNVDLGPSASSSILSFGLAVNQTGITLDGQVIPYTRGTPVNNGCLSTANLTAQGNVNGNAVTLVVRDASSNSTITINGTVNSAVSEIDGTFSTAYGSLGGSPACANDSGVSTLRKQ